MEITGKLSAIMPLVTGTTKSGGTWEKQDFIIETIEEYPKKIYITSFNKGNVSQLPLGTELTVSVNIESREYNGKWYTNLICKNFVINQQVMPFEQPFQQQQQYVPQQQQTIQEESNYSSNLPF